MGNTCSPCCTSSEESRNRNSEQPLTDARSSPAIATLKKPKIVVALFSYEARDSQDVSFIKGDRMEVRDDSSKDWLFVKHLTTGSTGYIPVYFVAEEQSVESEDWFFENISRREAENLLLADEALPRGTFLVRRSEQVVNGYSLSLKDWNQENGHHVKHYRITEDNGGFYINQSKTFYSLAELVWAHSRKAYGLAHVLSKPCKKPEPTTWDLGPTYKDRWEIERNEIELLRKLGSGNYGDVYYGKWRNRYEVAVKTIKKNKANKSDISPEAFLQEAHIMKKFRHKRLVQLYGVCTYGEPLFIVQEYMEKGNLLDFLRSEEGRALTLNDLVFIAYQVASGMAHLESLNFIHRDLAARNILLGRHNIAKICDFGLARIMEQDIYVTRGGELPIKWTAPEAIVKSTFSVKSDVWSYGVLLMELFTYGGSPYQDICVRNVIELVTNGYRMKKPPEVPEQIYQIMVECWNYNPKKRPSFKSLERRFANIEVSFQANTVVFNRAKKSYEDYNPIFDSNPNLNKIRRK